MPVPKNLVWEQSSSTGTGNKTLARYGGFARVSEAFGTGDAGAANPILFFANKDATSAEWEVVQGYMSDANTFVPGTIIASSNGGSAVTFTSGLKVVTNDVPASLQIYLDSNAASPPSNDGASLGKAGTAWSDIYLAAGGQVNWNNSTAYLYESSGNLIWVGGDFDMRKTGSSPALVTARQDTHATGIAVGSVYHKGRDNGGTAKTYAITQGFCDGNTAGSENGSWHVQVMKAGTVTDVMTLTGSAIAPTTSDGLALGTTSKMWSDLLLASGGVINFNNGDVTATHASNSLAFAGASSGYTFDAAVTPATSGGAALGSSSNPWHDAYFSNSTTLDFAGITLTRVSGYLLLSSGFKGQSESNPGLSSSAGFAIANGGAAQFSNSGGVSAYMNRCSSDGTLIDFRRDGSSVGNITVSSGTVSITAFSGSHWGRFGDGDYRDIPMGTILEAVPGAMRWKFATFTLDDVEIKIAFNGPGEHGDTVELEFNGDIVNATLRDEEPDQPLSKNVRVEIATAASTKVYGVFNGRYSDEEGWNDVLVTAAGNYWVRMAAGQTPDIGDLIESGDDGCGVVQSDDVVRSKTVGKITNATPQHTYKDGSFLVPCVLYCG